MEYTFSALLSAVGVVILDRCMGTRLLTRPRFWLFLAIMYTFMIPVNGYLTARPIVLYGTEHHMGIRLLTMPVEDFVYGFSFMTFTLIVWEFFKKKELRSPKAYTLEREQFFPVPAELLFPFFEKPENLGSITPSWLKFNITSPLPIVMKPGAEIEYTISWLGIPLRWKTLIEEFSPPDRFVDSQVRGPYALWKHTHSFARIDGGTIMTDHVVYALPFGILGSLAHSLGIRKQLQRIFDHRANILSKQFSGK